MSYVRMWRTRRNSSGPPHDESGERILVRSDAFALSMLTYLITRNKMKVTLNISLIGPPKALIYYLSHLWQVSMGAFCFKSR
jgi:hypothetical protein